jgi:hypothetical protein
MNLRDWQLRVRAFVARNRVERELDEELSFHVERIWITLAPAPSNAVMSPCPAGPVAASSLRANVTASLAKRL